MSSSKGNNGFWKLALILGVSAASAASAAYLVRHHSHQTGADASSSNKNDEEKVNGLIEQRFQACSQHMSKRIPKLPRETQLDFYAWYKQATLGDASSSPPPAYDLVKQAKYQAWCKHKGMTKSSAMQLYIDKAMLVEFTAGMQDSEDEDADNMDDFEDAVMDIGGLGNKPSTLINTDDTDNADFENSDMYPLHKAAHYGNIQELKKILQDAKTDPNAMDASGQTALHLCADRGHVDCMNALMKAGANLNAGDNDGITALQAAVISGHKPACLSLLAAGADPDQEDRDGDTPRACAEDDDDIKQLFRNIENQSNDNNNHNNNNKSNGDYLKDLDQIQLNLDEGDLDI